MTTMCQHHECGELACDNYGYCSNHLGRVTVAAPARSRLRFSTAGAMLALGAVVWAVFTSDKGSG